MRSLRRVWLEVHAENERAIRAYRACGFVEEGRLREQARLDGR
jgi:RimJ/RimL family protein N-acetyltransferase